MQDEDELRTHPLLNRDQILKADDGAHEDVAVPEWGGTVRVKALTGRERDAFEASVFRSRGKSQAVNLKNFRAKLIVLSVVDETGDRMFTEPDVDALGAKSAAAMQRVFDVAMRLAGMREEDVEEQTEGFDDAPTEDSSFA